MSVLRWDLIQEDRILRAGIRSRDLSADDRQRLNEGEIGAVCASCDRPGLLRGRILYHQHGTCQMRPRKPPSFAGSGDVTETTAHETGKRGLPRANWLEDAQTCDASGWFRGHIDQVVADHHDAIWQQLERLDDPICVASNDGPLNAGGVIRGGAERAIDDPRIDTEMRVCLVKHHSQPANPAEPWFQYVKLPGLLEIRSPKRPRAAAYLEIFGVIHLVVSGAVSWDRDSKRWCWTHPKRDELIASVESLVNQPPPQRADWRALLVGLPIEKLREVRFVVRS
jgi:hypothetical protein